MAFTYNTGVKNKMLSMSLDLMSIPGASISFGGFLNYSGSDIVRTYDDAFTLQDSQIVVTNTASYIIGLPSADYIQKKSTLSASLAQIFQTYSTPDDSIQFLIQEGEDISYSCPPFATGITPYWSSSTVLAHPGNYNITGTWIPGRYSGENYLGFTWGPQIGTTITNFGLTPVHQWYPGFSSTINRSTGLGATSSPVVQGWGGGFSNFTKFQDFGGTPNRLRHRHLKGGISITSKAKTPPLGGGGVGTMGLICQDSASGALVGLTNNHVVIDTPFYSYYRDTGSISNLADAFSNELDLYDGNNPLSNPPNVPFNINEHSSESFANTVFQDGEGGSFNSDGFNTTFLTNLTASTPLLWGGPKQVGRVVRYVNLHNNYATSILGVPAISDTSSINNVDAAIFSIYCTSSMPLNYDTGSLHPNALTKLNFTQVPATASLIDFQSSSLQVGLEFIPGGLEWATTNEIDNIINTNPPLYSAGRTTGGKGAGLTPLRFLSFANIVVSGYKLEGTGIGVRFDDVIKFISPSDSGSYHPTGSSTGVSATVCPFPGYKGDSGSSVIAYINGSYKVIGLLFAGDGGFPTKPGNTGTIPGNVIPYTTEQASSVAYACRIDHIADQLKVRAWTGSTAPVIDTVSFKTTPGLSLSSSLECTGSHYQVGITRKHNECQ